MTDMVADLEKAKYEDVWDHDAYRKFSPGEHLVARAIKDMGMGPGDSLFDFGCGTGRATQQFRQRGIRALGMDIAKNCLDPAVQIPFSEVCLWDIPEDWHMEFGFCTDVMEHIPEHKVDATIGCISRAVGIGCFFQIATRPDAHGPRLIGKPLHLTVHDAQWWRSKLAKQFALISMDVGSGGVIFTACH